MKPFFLLSIVSRSGISFGFVGEAVLFLRVSCNFTKTIGEAPNKQTLILYVFEELYKKLFFLICFLIAMQIDYYFFLICFLIAMQIDLFTNCI